MLTSQALLNFADANGYCTASGERSSIPHIVGGVRTVQNWISGSSYNPCSGDRNDPPSQFRTRGHRCAWTSSGGGERDVVRASVSLEREREGSGVGGECSFQAGERAERGLVAGSEEVAYLQASVRGGTAVVDVFDEQSGLGW